MSASRSRFWPARGPALVLAVLALIAGGVVGCGEDDGGNGAQGGGGQGPQNLSIAYQFGIGYAQLAIIKNQNWLERDLPGTRVRWRQLATGAAVRDGIISGDLHLGSGAPPPFLVGSTRVSSGS